MCIINMITTKHINMLAELVNSSESPELSNPRLLKKIKTIEYNEHDEHDDLETQLNIKMKERQNLKMSLSEKKKEVCNILNKMVDNEYNIWNQSKECTVQNSVKSKYLSKHMKCVNFSKDYNMVTIVLVDEKYMITVHIYDHSYHELEIYITMITPELIKNDYCDPDNHFASNIPEDSLASNIPENHFASIILEDHFASIITKDDEPNIFDFINHMKLVTNKYNRYLN